MASPPPKRPHPSSSAAAAAPTVSPPEEELSDVQVIDSNEPLVTASSSSVIPSSDVVHVLDSSEPRVSALFSPASSSSSSNDDEPPHADELRSQIEEVQGDDIHQPSTSSGPSGRLINPVADELRAQSEEVLGDDENQPSTSGSSGRRIHPYADELRSMWNWRKIFERLGTHEQCVQFSEDRGIIPTQRLCRTHRTPMTLERNHGQMGRFRCRKRGCTTRPVSRSLGTWFEMANLKLMMIFQIMYAFCEGLSYEQTQKECAREDEPVLSAKTIADWFNFCRDTIVVYWLERGDHRDTKIGGEKKIVQIDESKFGSRKYNRGRHIEGHWVLGMIEDKSEDLRLDVCPDNDTSAEALVSLIKKHVQEGSIIHTDYWRAYLSLPEHGYEHKRVNHSDPENRFLAPDGTHTQRIESQWRGIKKEFRREHNKKDFSEWLILYAWRRKKKVLHLDPFEELLRAVIYVYDINSINI